MCSYFNHREVKRNWRLIENQEFERMNKDRDVTNLVCESCACPSDSSVQTDAEGQMMGPTQMNHLSCGKII